MSEDLASLLKKATEWHATASDAEKEAMWKAQREGYVRAELSWPKPKFKMVNGVKVYASYEDYCNG